MAAPPVAASSVSDGTRREKTVEDARGSRERRLSLFGLGAVFVCFAAFAIEAVGRAVNNVWGDIAFSGWSAAIGHRLALGQRIYDDFTLPLPPGSFLVMSVIERISGGGPSMLAESAVCAACCVAMSGLAYAMTAPLAGRRAALCAAAGTLAWICGWSKELAYDYLAEIPAYGGICILVAAFITEEEERARKLCFGAGLTVGATLFFKQSTASGLLGASLVGIGYLTVIDRGSKQALRRRVREASACLAGTLVGFAGCVVAILAMRGSVPGFLQAVFIDGPALKGGTTFLVRKTLRGLFLEPLVVMSLGQIVLVVLIGYLAMVHRGRSPLQGAGVGAAEPPSGPALRLRARHVLAVCLVFGTGFLYAAIKLAKDSPGVPAYFALGGIFSFSVVQSAAFLVVVVFFTNLRAPPAERSLHAYNAAVLSTLVLACGVGGSLTMFRPLDEANATIAIALVTLFSLLERGRLGFLQPVLLAVLVMGPLASRLPRCLMATTKADAPFWRGLRVNADGVEVLRAAARARVLAPGPEDTVLVLPEEPSLVALIDRPRPPLCGAIVFADQYPRRCLAPDQAYLRARPPKVIVTHPTEPAAWVSVFRTWNEHGPAEEITADFIASNMGNYIHDSAYRTPWGGGYAGLDVWVRR